MESGISYRGQTSMGCFYGLKLHLVVSECGELLNLIITPGNTDDCKPVLDLRETLNGKVFAERGYVSHKLPCELFETFKIEFFAKPRRNPKSPNCSWSELYPLLLNPNSGYPRNIAIATLSMSHSLLDEALQNYKEALSNLEQSESNLSAELALTVLKARDILQVRLDREDRSVWEGDRVLVELDDRLKGKAGAIVKVINLAKWRQSLQIDPEKAWWWELETEAPPHPWDRFDWLWKMGNVLGWTANVGLLLDIVPRFLVGGTGLVGAIAVTFPSLIALLQASNEFTQSGQEGFDKLLVRLRIPKHFHEEAKLVSIALFCLFLVVFRANLPVLSEWYAKQGTQRYREGQLATAEDYYKQALNIDPSNIKVNYNLGVIYEDLQELDKAEMQYAIAAKGGLVSAQNNLARLYIVEEQSEFAIPILWQGLSNVDEKLISVHYNLLKNLGWAFWLEGRHDIAESSLQEAIALAEKPEGIENIKNRGAAHCLLAQVYQQMEQKEEAIAQWQLCCQQGTIFNRDETKWLNLAHITLQEAGRSCEINPQES